MEAMIPLEALKDRIVVETEEVESPEWDETWVSFNIRVYLVSEDGSRVLLSETRTDSVCRL